MDIGHNEYSTQDLWQKDKDHFLHPWQHFDSFREEGALIISRGEGVHVFDTDGKRYLDGIGGLWCVNVGYGREELVEAMADQARKLPYFSPFTDTGNPPAAELAAKLAEIAPGSLNHVIYSSSGSASNDSAVRLAHYYHSRRGKPEKRHIISRRDSYHGSTYLGISLGYKKADRSPHFGYIEDIIHHVASPNPYRRPEGISEQGFCDWLVDDFETMVAKIGAENVAAFIAEPLPGAGGVIVPPEGYHKRIIERCKAHDILYISDEVVTAFGRLGHMFASKEVFGIEPDIISCAKGISSGYIPLGATLFSDDIFDVINAPDPDGLFSHGFTYSGHPVACAVGLKNIEIMEREDLCAHVRDVGDYMEQQLATLADLPMVGQVRGKRFMMCVEYVADKDTKELLPAEINISKRISNACEERGLIVRPVMHLNVLSPPLTLTRTDVDQLVDILRQSLLDVHGRLRSEGAIAA